MDPRKAATITAPDLLEQFAQGFTESQQQSPDEQLIHACFWFNGTMLRCTDYAISDVDQLIMKLLEHLAHGEGAEVRIEVLANDSSPEHPPELPPGA